MNTQTARQSAGLLAGFAFVLSCGFGCAGVPEPVREWAVTEDGWKLAVHHYAPEKPDPALYPVILCHGIGLNHRSWDISPDMSFARHLAAQGFDVWVPAVRGNGDSERHGGSAARSSLMLFRPQRLADLRAAGRTPDKPNGGDFTIDDHLQFDLPAVIAHVKRATGSDKVCWVGHSMGGMIILGALERFPRDDVAAAVTIGSPTMLAEPISPAMQLLVRFEGIADMLNDSMSLSAVTRFGALTAHRIPNPIDASYFNVENTDRSLFLLANRSVYEDVASGVLRDLAVLCRTRRWQSADGSYDYSANLANVTAPVLFLAGNKDAVASPDSVRHAYDRISSKEKSFFLVAPANGTKREYGHCDMILGLDAKSETWPSIVAWLRKFTRPR